MKTLAFDTSNTQLSISIDADNQQLASFFSDEKKTHSVTLLPAIKQCLQEANLDIKDIDEIIVAQGPGSFTGVRIAVTTAKTLAWTLNIDLKGISSLALIAANIKDEDRIIVPYFDARRSNVFAGAYQLVDGKLVARLADGHYVIDELLESLKEFDDEIVFVGPEIEELTTKATGKMSFSRDNDPDAHNLVKLAEQVQPVEDIDAFIPTYLRYTKAEYDWLKTDHKADDDDYVQRV